MAELSFELFNNQLLKVVVGVNDENMRLVEKMLNVEILSFGNQITIKGAANDVENAKTAINILYEKASKGHVVGEQEVKAAVRICGGVESADEKQSLSEIVLKTKKRYIYPRSATQAKYITEMMQNELVFGLGPAGTGKTYLAVALAVSMMLEGAVDKIILSRPAVEAGENLGFLPGDLKEKVDPYLRPLYDALYQIMGAESFQKNMEKGLIEVAPLAYMRGRTLDNAFIILDEAQNTTPAQMKMFLTRIGFGSKVIVTGDASQKDLPSGTRSGLDVAMQVLKKVDGISFCELTSKDVVRHPLVQKIVQAYDEYEKKAKPENHSGRAKSTTRKRRENK